MGRIFVSYRRQDSEVAAGRIYDRLEAHFGREKVFMDVDDIPLGVDFRAFLDRQIRGCDLLLAVIGPHWLTVRDDHQRRRLDSPQDYVRTELELALQRQIPVVPILLPDVTMPREDELPPSIAALAYRNAAKVDPGGSFRMHMDRLVRGMERLAATSLQGDGAMFRILSLDGGGIKGAFTTSVLAALEEDTGQAVADHFDLITGTSTGGIIAIGLGLGIPAGEILDFYRTEGPAIFPGTGRIQRVGGLIRQLFGPKHSHAVLREKLTAILGERKLGESKCRLVIPAYDAIAGRIFLLKTGHHPRFKYEVDAPAVGVALATSAAPTYFAAAPFPTHEDASYVDGGVWANSPVLVGLVEAVSFLDVPLVEIDMLSVGTTSVPFNIAEHQRSGIAKWNAGLIELMFEAQVEAAVAQARLLLGGQLHRIDYKAKPGEFSLDDARPEKIRQLINLGRGEAVKKDNLEAVKARFLNGTPAEPFEPLVPAGN